MNKNKEVVRYIPVPGVGAESNIGREDLNIAASLMMMAGIPLYESVAAMETSKAHRAGEGVIKMVLTIEKDPS